MICPKYKAGLLACAEVNYPTPGNKRESEMVQCDGSNCAWWDNTNGQCSIQTISMSLEEIWRQGKNR